jgi:hypothetical protein
MRWTHGGRNVTVHGWHALKRLRFAGVGVRWGAAVDVPDLALLPAILPGVDRCGRSIRCWLSACTTSSCTGCGAQCRPQRS